MPAAESTRFHVDLLHPGRVSRSWQDWVTGSRGGRRLALVTLAGALVLLAILFAGVLPASRRLGDDLAAVPGLTQRPGRPRYRPAPAPIEPAVPLPGGPPSGALGRRPDDPEPADPPGAQAAARRGGADGPAGRREPARRRGSGAAAAAGRAEETLRIEALTPARPGGPPLVDVAQFMAGLMRDPAVSRRFALKSWEIKPSAVATAAGDPRPRDQHPVDRARSVTRPRAPRRVGRGGPRLSRAPGL